MKQMLFVKTKMRPWNAFWQKVMNLFAARDYDVRLTSWTDDFTGLGSRFESLLPKEASDFSQTQPAEFHDVVGLDVGIDSGVMAALKNMRIQRGPMHSSVPL